MIVWLLIHFLLASLVVAAWTPTENYLQVFSKRTQSCVPPSSEAPYGLELAIYKKIRASTTKQYHKFIQAGCATRTIVSLSRCDFQSASEVSDLLQNASESCKAELSRSLKYAQHYLLDNGCVERQSSSNLAPVAYTSFHLVQSVSTIAESTTCSALVKSARRAIADALSGDTAATKEAQIEEESEAAASATTDQADVSLDTTLVTPDGSKSDESRQDSAKEPVKSNLWIALLAGALAGLAVDLSLFPLDTVKTRLQSAAGFRAAGGFKGLYQGIGSIALGSAPSSALFFLAYEFAGRHLANEMGESFLGHLVATTIGELASSIVRVPADVVKSRQQVEQEQIAEGRIQSAGPMRRAIARIYQEGARPNSRFPVGAFYTGWWSTMVREIPFGCIQFPLFSHLKSLASVPGSETPLSMPLTALCGMLAGSVAGSLTTPLDVVKTRIMLAEHEGGANIAAVLAGIVREDGLSGLFRGVLPRTLWISLGGAIFLGGYDGFVRLMEGLT